RPAGGPPPGASFRRPAIPDGFAARSAHRAAVCRRLDGEQGGRTCRNARRGRRTPRADPRLSFGRLAVGDQPPRGSFARNALILRSGASAAGLLESALPDVICVKNDFHAISDTPGTICRLEHSTRKRPGARTLGAFVKRPRTAPVRPRLTCCAGRRAMLALIATASTPGGRPRD